MKRTETIQLPRVFLTACAALALLLALLPLTLANPAQAYADDPSVKLEVRVNDTTSTSENAAIYLEGDRIYLDVSYTGLQPSTDYKVDTTRIYIESPYATWTGTRSDTLTTSSTGEGTWTIDVTDRYKYLGVKTTNRVYPVERFWFRVAVASADETERYTAGPVNFSSSFPATEHSIYAASLTSTVVVNGTLWAGDYKAATIEGSTAQQGVNVSSEIEYSGLRDNTDYKVTSRMMHKTADGLEQVGEPVITNINSGPPRYRDSYNSVRYFKETMIDLGEYDNLQEGEQYVVLHTIEPSLAKIGS